MRAEKINVINDNIKMIRIDLAKWRSFSFSVPFLHKRKHSANTTAYFISTQAEKRYYQDAYGNFMYVDFISLM